MINSIHNAIVQLASVVDQIPGVYQPREDLEHEISTTAMRTVGAAALTLIVLTIIAALTNNRTEVLKKPLFILMSTTMVVSTGLLIFNTVRLNVTSDSGGPVHWHADIEYWACGNELELRNPIGALSNKIGSATLHEHDDRRIHLEGVVVEQEFDASLGKFMHVIGGAITDDALVVPLDDDVSKTFENDIDGDGDTAPDPAAVEPYIMNDGDNGRVAYFTSGQTCNDQEAEVQTFVYRFNEDDNTYKQYKLDNPEEIANFGVDSVQQFSILDDSNVPPGDCIIFEFDRPKSKTDKLCEQYGVRDVNECERFGVEPSKRGICENTQVDYDPDLNYYITDESEESNEEVLGARTFQELDTPGTIPTDIEALGASVGRAVQNPETLEAEVLGATSTNNDEVTGDDALFYNLGITAGNAASESIPATEGGAQ